jgi:hypothetical protein
VALLINLAQGLADWLHHQCSVGYVSVTYSECVRSQIFNIKVRLIWLNWNTLHAIANIATRNCVTSELLRYFNTVAKLLLFVFYNAHVQFTSRLYRDIEVGGLVPFTSQGKDGRSGRVQIRAG